MPNVFISYSSENRAAAETFGGLVDALGYQVWIDRKALVPGREWFPSLVAGLESSDWLLVLVSRDSAASEWVKHEVRWAAEHRKGRVIPIVLDEAKPEDVDESLAKLHHGGDYGANQQETVNKIVKVLSDARHAGYGRGIEGRWWCAVQPIYYQRDGWHVQEVVITGYSDAYTVRTEEAAGKLQWRLDARLVANGFLGGPFHSLREGSRSHGYMAMQLARNGTYMCGHHYGVAFGDTVAHFGIILLARTEEQLGLAWQALKAAQREMKPLDQRTEFPL